MISLTSEYAVRAAVYLARVQQDRPNAYSGARQIAAAAGVPGNYLGKILQQLARTGILDSRKGSGGGFRLARDPHSITLLDVVSPLEHNHRLGHCPMGQVCGESEQCTMHVTWQRLIGFYLQTLQSKTLGQIAQVNGRAPTAKRRSRRAELVRS